MQRKIKLYNVIFGILENNRDWLNVLYVVIRLRNAHFGQKNIMPFIFKIFLTFNFKWILDLNKSGKVVESSWIPSPSFS